jgi:hypothetical protein
MPGRDIFISYASKEEAIARLACERLEQASYSCWFAPRDIPAGEFFAGQIIQALRESRFVLLLFSQHSNASQQVVREINFAVSQRLSMLAVRLDQTPLSNDFEYLIRISQWLDVSHLASDEDRVVEISSRIEAAVGLTVYGLSRFFARSSAQTKDRAFCFVEPVMQILHPMLALNRKVLLMALCSPSGRQSFHTSVNVHIKWHLAIFLSCLCELLSFFPTKFYH